MKRLSLGTLALVALVALALAFGLGEQRAADALAANTRLAASVANDIAALPPAPAAAVSHGSEEEAPAPFLAERPSATTSEELDDEESDDDPSLVDGASDDATPLWAFLDEPLRGLDQPVGPMQPERHALRLELAVLRDAEVGERFRFPVPGMGDIEATVHSIETSPNGDIALFAVLDDFDHPYSAVFSVGDRVLFGSLMTPRGSYVIESSGGEASIFEDHLDELINTSVSDELLPPDHVLTPPTPRREENVATGGRS